MADPGWYPPAQVCYPPELPTYLRNVYDLQPIVGVPSDTEVMGIHAVIQVAKTTSEIPGMHGPGLIMKLTDHLFGVQMARYRSKYSLITFPSDATYTPPALPALVTTNLEPILGAPSDDDIMKVQDAIQTYQDLRRFPSVYDEHVNMELSQHLFDIQMARYMRLAGTSPPQLTQANENIDNSTRSVGEPLNQAEQATSSTNNVGTGANASATEAEHTYHFATGSDISELMERSNHLADRFNQILERFNELMARFSQPTNLSSSQSLPERFDQVLERLTGLVEQFPRSMERSDGFTEQFRQLFERFNQLVEQSCQSTQRTNELSERSNELADRANQLAEQLNHSSERSNQLSEQVNKSDGEIRNVLGNINRVLVGIQHAIVRNHKGNTFKAADCLVNERGETPAQGLLWHATFEWLSTTFGGRSDLQFPVVIEGVHHNFYIDDDWLGRFLRFYGVGNSYFENETSTKFKENCSGVARIVFGRYLSACIG